MNNDAAHRCVNCSSLLPRNSGSVSLGAPARTAADGPKATMRSAWLVDQLQDAPPTPTYTSGPIVPVAEPTTMPCVDATCGYPVRVGAAICPRCGTSQVVAASPPGDDPRLRQELDDARKRIANLEALLQQMQTEKELPAIEPPTRHMEVGFTINPFLAATVIEPPFPASPPPVRKFRLTALQADGSTPTGEAHVYEGDETLLDRANLDPANLTISVGAHCKVYHNGDSWMVQDLSTHRATFRRLDEPTALEPGDVLLLGDRLYRFETLG